MWWVEAERCWRLLGRTEYGELADVRTLAGGTSGAAVYQLRTQRGDEFVLKVNRNCGQADRELTFYRDLAVPIRVPALIAEVDGCLLLESAGTPADATRFSTTGWETSPATSAACISSNHLLPSRVDPDPPVPSSAQIWAELGQYLTNVWPDLPRIHSALAALPTCLLDGDFHLGNLLVDEAGEFVWIDWQEITPGHGPRPPLATRRG